MRRVRNVRHLATHEIQIAKEVFFFTIPYDQVLVSDALGKDDRPFTLPTSLPTTLFFNVSTADGKYVIHAGDGYYGLSTDNEDKKTLIHELTHVWQGEHDSATYWAFALLAQTGSSDPYKYDYDHLVDDWNMYNVEQQAQIVEDWFAAGKKTYDPDTEQGDKRFYFIKTVIRGERVTYDWLARTVKPLPSGTLHVPFGSEISATLDEIFVPLLKERYAASDVAGYSMRLRRVEEFLGKIDKDQAMVLRERLEARKPNDELVRYFFGHLSHETANRLLGIVRAKWPYSKSKTTQ